MSAIFESRDLADTVTDKLKAYAQPQRLMILSCLLRGERNVAEIGDVTGIGQPALSQQLAELRRAELVSTRKEAKQVWYALADESVEICVGTMEAMFCGGAKPLSRVSVRESGKALAGGAGFARLI